MPMGPRPFEAPAFFSLIVFLAMNYLVGYGLGWLLTHSVFWSIAIALVTPCLSLLGIALLGGRPGRRRPMDEA